MKRIIAIFLVACPLSAQVVNRVNTQTDCLPQNLPNLLKIIEEGSDHSKILDAIKCVPRLSKAQSIKMILLKRLEKTLHVIESLSDNVNPMRLPELAVTLANSIEKMNDSLGYKMIIDYFRNAKWSKFRDQEFFNDVGALVFSRTDMTEIFFLALTQLPPTTSALGRACQYFNANLDKMLDPRFVQGIVSAIVRIERAKNEKNENPYHFTVLKGFENECKKTFLAQLLNEQLRNSFIQKYGVHLSTEEKNIVSRFLNRIQVGPDSLVAEKMVHDFFNIPWGKAYPDSIKTSIAICDTFKSEGYETRIDDLWGYRCNEENNNITQTLFYYPDSNGKICTLQKIRFSRPSASRTILKVLQNRLAQQMGPGSKVKEVNEFGSAYWQEIMFWNWNGVEVYCFRNIYESQFGSDLPLIEILARHNQLTKIIKEADSVEVISLTQEEPEKQLVNHLSNDLRLWRAMDINQILHCTDPDSIFIVLNSLLSWKASNSFERGAQLYLADLLAQSMSIKFESLTNKEKKEQTLSTFGVRYAPGYDGIEYNHGLMKKISKEGMSGFWADEAFQWYLTEGWYTESSNEQPEAFLNIIAWGEEFLKQNPDSHIRGQVILALAEAHETGWSLSCASSEDAYVDRVRYQQAAENHRLQSIMYYEKLIRDYPKSHHSIMVREKLKRLRLKLDTNSRAFYYISDC